MREPSKKLRALNTKWPRIQIRAEREETRQHRAAKIYFFLNDPESPHSERVLAVCTLNALLVLVIVLPVHTDPEEILFYSDIGVSDEIWY